MQLSDRLAVAILGLVSLSCGSVTPAMPNPITEPVVPFILETD